MGQTLVLSAMGQNTRSVSDVTDTVSVRYGTLKDTRSVRYWTLTDTRSVRYGTYTRSVRH